MDSFFSTLKQMDAKDKEVFLDESGDIEWKFRSDGTGIMILGEKDGKTHVKFTEEHLNHCRAPLGFRRKTTDITEELSWLSGTMDRAAKRMKALKEALTETAAQ